MKVMIVDDEEDITRLTGIVFEINGHETIKAYSGEECLRILEKGEKPDVIVLDIMMPGTSGYDICKKIKSDERFNGTPIVILSAKSEPKEIEEGLRAGATGYITKPFDPDTLVRQVEGYAKVK